jgi:hypothetical protein
MVAVLPFSGLEGLEPSARGFGDRFQVKYKSLFSLLFTN